MSEFTIKKISDRAGTGAPSFTYGLNISGSDSGLIGIAYTASGTEPSSPANGDTWYDSTNDKYVLNLTDPEINYFFINAEFPINSSDNNPEYYNLGPGPVVIGNLVRL